MRCRSFLLLTILAGLLAFLTPRAPMLNAQELPPVPARLVMVEGMDRVYESRAQDGSIVTFRIPSGSLADVKVDSGAPMMQTGGMGGQSMVPVTGTVLSVDPSANLVRIQTRAGQTLLLAMPTQEVMVGQELALLLSR